LLGIRIGFSLRFSLRRLARDVLLSLFFLEPCSFALLFDAFRYGRLPLICLAFSLGNGLLLASLFSSGTIRYFLAR
jgi:hypothetical protein